MAEKNQKPKDLKGQIATPSSKYVPTMPGNIAPMPNIIPMGTTIPRKEFPHKITQYISARKYRKYILFLRNDQ